jgi:bilirubin oxidase
MQRRSFLLAGAATLAASSALAQMMMGDMLGMSRGKGAKPSPAKPGGPLSLLEGAPLRELTPLANLSQETGLFEAKLVAAPSKTQFAKGLDTPILAYNGQTPGPLIEAFEGDCIRIHFANHLQGEETTVHWHGLPVPADQDGNPMDAVAAGAERVYEFTLPEGSAGSYWYHPHPHGRTAEQVYAGLAGAFIVRAKTDPIPAAYGDTALFFTDLRLASDGSMPANTMIDMMNGRIGDHLLVNGQKNPVLNLKQGEKRRFRLFNATNARYLRLSFGGAPITIVGTDGGLIEAPYAAGTDLLLSPAERQEIVVGFDKQGTARLSTLAYDRGWTGPGRPQDAGQTLMTFVIERDPVAPQSPLPARLRMIADLGVPIQTRRFVFGESMNMGTMGMDTGKGMGMGKTMDMSKGMDMGNAMAFTINGASFDMERVDTVMKLGEVEDWEIANPTDMDHPFHVHGTQFQIIECVRGATVSKPPYTAWKDIVNVPRGQSVRIALRMDRPGLRMYHCHILEHEQLGMMGLLDVQA